MGKELVPGTIVKVYCDPVMCKDLEGKAKLVKFINPQGFYDGAELSLWEVKFLDNSDNHIYSRTINSENN